MMFRHRPVAPSDHVIRYARGKAILEGRGVGLLRLPHFTPVASVPSHSIDARLRFTGWTSDYQRVRAEVDIVFRISSAKKAASHLDFTVRRGEDRRRNSLAVLKRRVLNVARTTLADEIGRMPVRKAISSRAEIGRSVKIRMGHSRLLSDMGVTAMGVHVKDVECSTELAEAIEAENLRPALLTGQAHGASLSMSEFAGRSGTRGMATSTTIAPSIECTDSCPFRDLCEDYMRDIRGGRAWCTLFHEFST